MTSLAAIKVLLVDDMTTIRKLVVTEIAKYSDITIFKEAVNGKSALMKLERYPFDVIVLDVEMPVMGGLEALEKIRLINKAIPVIMFSSVTRAGASITIEALAKGASEFVAKPSTGLDGESTIQKTIEDLVFKIRTLVIRNKEEIPAAIGKNLERKVMRDSFRPEVVAVGSSTGGPNALMSLITSLKTPLPVPMLITQHMPPMFTSMLAERLNSLSSSRVMEAREGEEVRPGNIYLAPGGFHMMLNKDKTIRLLAEGYVNSCRPSVDVMMNSLIEVYGGNMLAVMLTGMGQDGQKSFHELYKRGGEIIAQDKASSVVWSMPSAVIQLGIVRHICPITQIAEKIQQYFSNGSTGAIKQVV